MNTIAKTSIPLIVITVVAGLCLGIVYDVTKEPIAAETKRTQDEAMEKVMPAADDFQTVEGPVSGTISSINGAYEGGKLIGYVINVTPSGFGGKVSTMVGVDLKGVITGLTVVSMSESPGLGARSTEPAWQAQFAGLTAPIKVTKDGGQIQAITGATITSRAVSAGATEACEWVKANGGAK